MMPVKKVFKTVPSRKNQRGVTLLVALIVLIIIGLTSASVMRSVLSTDVVANNARVQTLATQAAQIGLRYCELQADNDANGTPSSLPEIPADYWSTFSHWAEKKVGIFEVPEDFMQSANSTFSPDHLPQCMVQKMLVAGKVAYQVTARGFSPDYAPDDDGYTDTGSAVWLQSVIYLN
jgi:type II secretory pathway pseudopilin PulG